MPKNANSLVMDAAFDYVDQADTMRVLSAYTAGDSHATVVTNTLASVAMTVDTDYPKAAGDVSGRKITVAAKNGVSVSASGTPTHIALTRTSDTSVRYVTTCTGPAFTSCSTVNIPAWKIEIQQPT